MEIRKEEAFPVPRFSGITARLFIWFFAFVLIFFTAVFVLYRNVHHMMRISETIIERNYRISSASKTILEHLLRMEESAKKHRLIPQAEYREHFISAQREFEKELEEILEIEGAASEPWGMLRESYRRIAPSPESLRALPLPGELWIPEAEIDAWTQAIFTARLVNEREIEAANRELNRRGLWTVRAGLAGLGVAVFVGVLGAMLLSHSMIRPLGELLRGIRSVSRDSPIRPMVVHSADEFGELAASFNEMAERLTEEQRMRSDFISMLSHEIRTPLTSIRESVNLIGEGIMGPVTERQRRFLDIAGQEIARVSDLLKRILQVSRMESGALEIEWRSISAAAFAAECLDRFKASAAAREISLSAELPPELPEIWGDEGHLRQVFANVLGNAVKFAPPGGVVTLRAVPEIRLKRLRFSVSDDGPGIPKSEQPFIFNKYYRARSARARTDGAGLGLSIARHIVEAHGGGIWVAGDEGRGTSIFFTLPIFEKAMRS
jgi:signal transduction histidine kinase